MTLAAGRLRHRVSLQQLTPVLDSDGDVIQDMNTGEVARIWSTLTDLWAAIEPLSGKEFIQSQAYQSKVTGRVVIRWTPGINAGMRFVHQRDLIPDLFYNIEAVLPDRDSGMEYMTCLVSQGVNEG
jgi:SPP1 family predicted phage head-tail adaptor